MKILIYNNIVTKQVYGQTVTASAQVSLVMDGVRCVRYSANKDVTIIEYDVYNTRFISGNRVEAITSFLADSDARIASLGDIPYNKREDKHDDDDDSY